MNPRLPLMLALSLAACAPSDSSDAFERYANAEQRYTVAQPDGWKPAIVRGLTQFSTANADRAKHTIVVRAADLPPEITEGKRTTHKDVIAATERALRGLPRAKLGAPESLLTGQLPGARFSVTFVPRGKQATYRREHAVLIGTRRLYHVMYTRPDDEPIDAAAFQQMVTTLTEGV
jgi:hypothetical protein